MFQLRCVVVSIALFAVLAAMTSCVERKERLNISPNASVHWVVTHKSDSLTDLYEGDAVPRIAGGWIADQQVTKDDSGKETFTLVAERLLIPGEPLPENFALHTEADGDLFLQFPTTVKIEQRHDGTYYHFARTYPARRWAYIAVLEERLVKAPMADFADLELDEWTKQQRLTAVQAFAAFETEKMLTFARAAFLHATPDFPQDAWLAIRRHLLECTSHYDYDRLAKLLEPRDSTVEEDARGEAIRASLAEMEELTTDQMKQAVFTLAGYNGSQYTRFMAEYDRQKKAYEITQDLGDDSFEITVEMPGEIIASNAESFAGNAASWTFDGGVIRDRDIELLATSRLAN